MQLQADGYHALCADHHMTSGLSQNDLGLTWPDALMWVPSVSVSEVKCSAKVLLSKASGEFWSAVNV